MGARRNDWFVSSCPHRGGLMDGLLHERDATIMSPNSST